MLIFILGLVVFFAIHVVRMLAPGFREAQIAKMGEGPWKGIYSLVSALGLGLIIWGWMRYRLDAPEIYTPPEWGWHATLLLVLVALILNFAAYVPTGKIKATVGNPFLLAVILWSIGHLVANGDLASLILFGSFLIYSVWNLIAVVGRDQPTPVFATYWGDVLAVALGLGTYVVLILWLHVWLFGVPPM